jgi:carbon monoxide dehydrogenase subunit G
VPGVQSVERIESSDKEAYRVQVMEKVGPFKVTMKLEIGVTEIVEPSVLGATVKGGDAIGMSRATGTVRVESSELSSGTSMSFKVNVEVLGKLATLGAPVIRRRVTELFSEFGRRVIAEFPVGTS